MLGRASVMEHDEYHRRHWSQRGTGDRVRFVRPRTKRGTAMHYRIYLLGSDNHISRGHDVHSSSDLEAFAEITPIIGISPAAGL